MIFWALCHTRSSLLKTAGKHLDGEGCTFRGHNTSTILVGLATVTNANERSNTIGPKQRDDCMHKDCCKSLAASRGRSCIFIDPWECTAVKLAITSLMLCYSERSAPSGSILDMLIDCALSANSSTPVGDIL